MRIVIAGGHGQIAMRLEKLLTEHGDSPVGIIRDPEQADDLRAVGRIRSCATWSQHRSMRLPAT